MQEPILFNISIKANILYGNLKASDQRVRQCADMANALQFIESDVEDLKLEEVNQRINQEFENKVKENIEKTDSLLMNGEKFNIEDKKLII